MRSTTIPLTLATALAFASAASADLATGLQGYWKFNGTDGDSSGNGRDMTRYNGAGYGQGLLGGANGALSLDGSNDYAARAANDTAFDFAGDFAVQVWANFGENPNEMVLIEKFTGAGGPGWTFTAISISHHLQFYSQPTTSVNAYAPTNFSPLQKGVWHHFVMTRSGNTFTMWLNGVSIASATGTGQLSVSGNVLNLGRRTSGNYYLKGRMDEVAIWNRNLTAHEIGTLYNGGGGYEITAIPLPAPALLAGVGFLGLMLPRRRF